LERSNQSFMKRILFEIIEKRNIRNGLQHLGGSSAGDRDRREIVVVGQLEYCDADPRSVSAAITASRNPGVSPVVNVRLAVPERESQPVAVLAFGNPVTERVIVSSPWTCHVALKSLEDVERKVVDDFHAGRPVCDA
jgi:hypothetical protein